MDGYSIIFVAFFLLIIVLVNYSDNRKTKPLAGTSLDDIKRIESTWKETLSRAILSLPISAIPKQNFTTYSFEQVLPIAEKNVIENYSLLSASLKNFQIGNSIRNKSGDTSYHVTNPHGTGICLAFHPGYSEYSITIYKHGENRYYILKYSYYAGDDDGGKLSYY
jgi:hypothetical protein